MVGEKTFSKISREPLTTVRKGRNNTLIARRNDCLIARYFYYGYYKNKTYEDTLRLLVNEFFLSQMTIIGIIQTRMGILEEIKERHPSIYYLQSHWPHLKW